MIATVPTSDRVVVFAYGGGVNTIAAMLLAHELGVVPRAILMAHPGSERKGTDSYRDDVMQPWCAARGWPAVTVIERREEGKTRPRAWRLETLREECRRIGALPSVAYFRKKCSQKYKGEPQRWWMARQQWALDEWAAGRRIIRAMGYDADEGARVAKGRSFFNPWEEARFEPWYPLFDADMGREDCVEKIRAHGLPIPPKSACTFCPNNQEDEWRELARDEPESFADAVEMSREAFGNVTAPDVAGLLHCFPRGGRQLHEWVDAGMPSVWPAKAERRQLPLFDAREAMPCECAT